MADDLLEQPLHLDNALIHVGTPRPLTGIIAAATHNNHVVAKSVTFSLTTAYPGSAAVAIVAMLPCRNSTTKHLLSSS